MYFCQFKIGIVENSRKFIIFGLGNAEEQYTGTRHNIGFEVVNAVAKKLSATFRTDRYAYVAEGKYKGRTLILVMPTTYMNLSGKAVKYWMEHEKVEPPRPAQPRGHRPAAHRGRPRLRR